MIGNEEIALISVLGAIAFAIFILIIFFWFLGKKTLDQDKSSASEDIYITETDIELWMQERNLMIPRLILTLTSNSILFLGYVQVRTLIFGGVISIFSIILNVLYCLYLIGFARAMDNLEKRIVPKIPIEYRRRTLRGRWGFIPLMIILQLIWVFSAFHSFFGWFE